MLRPDQVGQGSGAMNFIRQLGGAFGVNLLVVFMERRTIMHADAFAATQTSDNSSSMALLGEVARMLHGAGLPDIQLFPVAAGFLARSVIIQASTAAFRDGFLIVTVVFLLALIPTWMMHRLGRKKKSEAAGEPAQASKKAKAA